MPSDRFLIKAAIPNKQGMAVFSRYIRMYMFSHLNVRIYFRETTAFATEDGASRLRLKYWKVYSKAIHSLYFSE
ncbi:hypothetical protein FHS16_004227 [Paenibacillus endophyticus]|uniref:Uncharacterized protein n=1 Tax=Paenibacillus endophyticus TaxID=1294268 RepID=A0A7W5GBT8_9BACL|nr:hypothetical protein [Paenibacillus endophyticus]